MHTYKVSELDQPFESVGYEPATYVSESVEYAITRYLVTTTNGTRYEFRFILPDYVHSSHLVEIARFISDAGHELQSIAVL